jgi:hypothetical protein
VSETDVVRGCLDLLALRGILAWRNNTTGVYDPSRRVFRKFSGRKGVSDILAVLPGGRFLAVECKMPGKKPSPEQQSFLDEVTEQGGVGIWVTSLDELQHDLDCILHSDPSANQSPESMSSRTY